MYVKERQISPSHLLVHQHKTIGKTRKLGTLLYRLYNKKILFTIVETYEIIECNNGRKVKLLEYIVK